MSTILFDFVLAALVHSINCIALIIDTYIFSQDRLLQRFKQQSRLVQKLAVICVVVPLWVSPLIPQLRFDANRTVTILIGTGLLIGGVALIGLAFTKIGTIPSIRPESNLLSTGVYGLVRHPIYAGTILAFGGLSLLFHALVSLAYWPIAVLLYYRMIVVEERRLMREYGDAYAAYRKKVRARLIPFLF
jgi:protein-S-isoprenylcysteine O-methyltransferase Ste14